MWRQKIFSLILTKPLFKIHVSGVENIHKSRRPFLIIANHKTIFDFFALGNCIPISSKLSPSMIIGEGEFFNNSILQFLHRIGFIKILYCFLGVLPVTRGRNLDECLKAPIELLQKKGVVLIHPEGYIIKGDRIGKFKRGAPYMAIKTGVQILPIIFRPGQRTCKLSLRRNFYVTIGEPFTLPRGTSVENGAEIMRKTVTELYNSNLV
ncbi:lysophospholipid acyltransferase family protein [Patescibacteria group bacterium]